LLQGIIRLQEKIAAEGTGGRVLTAARDSSNGQAKPGKPRLKPLKSRWQRSRPAAQPQVEPAAALAPTVAIEPPLTAQPAAGPLPIEPVPTAVGDSAAAPTTGAPAEAPTVEVTRGGPAQGGTQPAGESHETGAGEPSSGTVATPEAPTVEVPLPVVSSAEALTEEVPIVAVPGGLGATTASRCSTRRPATRSGSTTMSPESAGALVAAVTPVLAQATGGAAEVRENFGQALAVVPPEQWIAALTAARDELGATFFDWLTAVDELENGYTIAAFVCAPADATAADSAASADAGLKRGQGLLLKTAVPRENAELPTATTVYRGANW